MSRQTVVENIVDAKNFCPIYCTYVYTGVCYSCHASSISKRANFEDIVVVYAQMVSRVLGTEGMRGMLRSSRCL